MQKLLLMMLTYLLEKYYLVEMVFTKCQGKEVIVPSIRLLQ